MLSEPAANLVKESSRIHLCKKKYSSSAVICDPCDIPSDLILHVNTQARFDDNAQSLLGHIGCNMDIVTLPPTLHSTEVITSAAWS